MKTSFGDSSDLPGELRRLTRITFKTDALQLKWHHCSSSADFLSQYYKGIFSGAGYPGDTTDLADAIVYMANELIENAVKFRADGSVIIEAGLSEDDFLLRIDHQITPEASQSFQALLEKITDGDPGELLIERLEANAAGDNESGSGLGLLTLINDYGARISWSFEQEAPEASVRLETVARLALSR